MPRIQKELLEINKKRKRNSIEKKIGQYVFRQLAEREILKDNKYLKRC